MKRSLNISSGKCRVSATFAVLLFSRAGNGYPVTQVPAGSVITWVLLVLNTLFPHPSDYSSPPPPYFIVQGGSGKIEQNILIEISTPATQPPAIINGLSQNR